MAKHSTRRARDEPLTSFAGTHKALARVLRAAREHGVTIRRTGGNHYKLETDDGPVYCSSTPRVGDIAAQRLKRDLRAKGVDLDGAR